MSELELFRVVSIILTADTRAQIVHPALVHARGEHADIVYRSGLAHFVLWTRFRTVAKGLLAVTLDLAEIVFNLHGRLVGPNACEALLTPSL